MFSTGAAVAVPDTTLAKVGGAWIDAETPWVSPSRSILSARTAYLLLEAGVEVDIGMQAVGREVIVRTVGGLILVSYTPGSSGGLWSSPLIGPIGIRVEWFGEQ